MSKHTPGPWFDWEEGEWLHEPHKLLENTADAHLIAMAPDLLKMLKVAQFWLDVDGRFDMQGINAAIAKAEGGEA